jgi:hypothetical protein
MRKTVAESARLENKGELNAAEFKYQINECPEVAIEFTVTSGTHEYRFRQIN